MAANNWNDTLPPEFARRGGQAGTETQRAARRANLQSYNESRSADADRRAVKLLQDVQKGLSHQEIAKEMNVNVTDLPTYLARADVRVRAIRDRAQDENRQRRRGH